MDVQALNRLAAVADQQDTHASIANGQVGAAAAGASGPLHAGPEATLRALLGEAGPSSAGAARQTSPDAMDAALLQQAEGNDPSLPGCAAPSRQQASSKQRGRRPSSSDTYAQRHQAAEARRRNRINER